MSKLRLIIVLHFYKVVHFINKNILFYFASTTIQVYFLYQVNFAFLVTVNCHSQWRSDSLTSSFFSSSLAGGWTYQVVIVHVLCTIFCFIFDHKRSTCDQLFTWSSFIAESFDLASHYCCSFKYQAHFRLKTSILMKMWTVQ